MLQSSTCFEQYYAHPQEVRSGIQHMVLPLSVSGHAVYWLLYTYNLTS